MRSLIIVVIAVLISLVSAAQVGPVTGGGSVCAGSMITLSDTSAGGTWSSSDVAIATVGSASGQVTGVAAGSAVITYTTSLGYAARSVTVTPLPTAYTVTGGGSYCDGGTGRVCGLSASQSGVTYQLYAGGVPVGAVVGGMGSALNFGPQTAAGSYTVVGSNTVTGCTRAMTGSVSIIVNPVPPPITGPGAVCQGASIALSDAAFGGSWNISNPSVLTTAPLSGLLGVSPGVATVTYILPGGCFTTHTVTVSPSPAPISGPSALCAGSAINLSSTPGGVWSTTNPSVASVGSLSGLVTGLSMGTSMIMYGLGTGCTVSKTVTVVAAPPAITGPPTVCQGGTASFTNAAPGGTWSSSNVILAIGSLSGVASGLSPGSEMITYSLGAGCISTKFVTVNPAPASIMGTPVVCTGSTTSLTDATAGGAWMSSAPLVAGVGSVSGIVTGIASGTATISYTLPNGCAASMPLAINASPLPPSGPATVCVGGSVTFSELVPGSWGSDNPSVLAVDYSGSFRGISPGVADVNFTVVSGCMSLITVTVVPAVCSGTPAGGTATASDAAPCIGTIVALNLTGASNGCGFVYQWQQSTDGTSFSDIAGASNESYSYSATARAHFRCKVTCQTTGLFAYSSTIPVLAHVAISSHALILPPDTACIVPDFYVSACAISSAFHVTSWFGDGYVSVTPLTSTGISAAHVLHSYSEPGTYTVKQVLYADTIPQDTVSFSYEYGYCHTMQLKFFEDTNGNCAYEAGERLLKTPVTVAVDSNDVAIDTVSATSGLYYKARGPVGTAYRFRIVEVPHGLNNTCFISGLTDTVRSGANDYVPKYIGLACSTTSGSYDLAIHASTQTGVHSQTGEILVGNVFCGAEDAIVTLHFSSRFLFASSDPAPASVSGNAATWVLHDLSSNAAAPLIRYRLDVPYWNSSYDHWLATGDTVHSGFAAVGPAGGDIDTLNNTASKNDTVRASWDPNDVSVNPAGYVLPCTSLQYTIRFENMGNDTARNIYVMDTLSANLDVHSLRIEAASGVMNTAITRDGGYTIAKFDLPGINLPDSVHSSRCSGMIVYTIKVKQGVPDGTAIANHAGIYFDDNPPVLTNTVMNTAGVGPVTGHGSVCAAAADTLSNSTVGGVWMASNTRASVANGVVIGISAGMDTVTYTVSNGCGVRSAFKLVSVNPLPIAGIIRGDSTVCTGATVVLADTISGGSWSSSMVLADVDQSGSVIGAAAGTALISYTISNSCGTATATKAITVNPLPGTITGMNDLCTGATSVLHDTATGGTWSSGNPTVANAGSATGVVRGFTAGVANITYTLPTTCMQVIAVTVHPLPEIYRVTGGGSYCAGGTGLRIWLDSSMTGTDYVLLHMGSPVDTLHGTGHRLNMGSRTLPGAYSVLAMEGLTGCVNNMSDSTTVVVMPGVIPLVSISPYPAGTVCDGTEVTFTPIATEGGMHPVFRWCVNGNNAGTGVAYRYAPANGDRVQVQLSSSATCADPDTATASTVLIVAHVLAPVVTVAASPAGIVTPGTDVTFTATVSGAGSPPAYQWVNRSTYIAGATTAIYTTNSLADGDTIRCVVVTANDCGTEVVAGSAVVTMDATGLRSRGRKGISIYPNPAHGYITVHYQPEQEDACLVVTDPLGRRMLSAQLQEGREMHKLDLAPLTRGVYLYSIVEKGVSVYMGKLLLE